MLAFDVHRFGVGLILQALQTQSTFVCLLCKLGLIGKMSVSFPFLAMEGIKAKAGSPWLAITLSTAVPNAVIVLCSPLPPPYRSPAVVTVLKLNPW